MNQMLPMFPIEPAVPPVLRFLIARTSRGHIARSPNCVWGPCWALLAIYPSAITAFRCLVAWLLLAVFQLVRTVYKARFSLLSGFQPLLPVFNL